MLKSAWPALDFDSLCAGPAHRGISQMDWSGPRVEFVLKASYSAEDHVALANRFINNPLWTKHACHVRLRATSEQDDLAPVSPAFLGLTRFTKMQSLALSKCLPAAEHMSEVFTALAPQLTALSIIPDWETPRELLQSVSLLTNLRLLSMASWCTADLIAPLVHLETLHLVQRFTLLEEGENQDLIVTIRRLSVEHQLRTVKIVDSDSEWEVDALESPLPDGLAPAALTDVSLLQGQIEHTLLLLPSLTRVEFGCSKFQRAILESPTCLPDCVSTSLRHLRIVDEAQCSRWSYRELGAHMPLVETIDTTQSINSISFDLRLFRELRELTANCGRDGLALVTLQMLSKLEHLTQLTVRIHPLYSLPSLTQTDLKALSRSRSFRRLVCILAGPLDGINCKPTFAMKLDEAERLLDLEVHVRSHSPSECAIYALQTLKAVSGARLQWRAVDRRCKEH